MVELLEARVVTHGLPRAVIADGQGRLVVRRRTTGWHLEAPLVEETFPVARWLHGEPVLARLDPGTCLAIEPLEDGMVLLELLGTRASVDLFLEWIRSDARSTQVRRLSPGDASEGLLTDLQEDALRRAVALGYYQIPRGIHLSQLAAKLHVSPAALSERLRRAEGRLVTHYVREADRKADGTSQRQP